MESQNNASYFGSRTLRLTAPYMIGMDVRILQALLNMLSGVIVRENLILDGIFGPLTRNAVRDFQKYFGLLTDGIVGQETYLRLGHRIGKYAMGEAVFSSKVLQNGARGGDVHVLQNRIVAFKKGYLNRPADGRYMFFTQEAVRRFQLDFPNLLADSIVRADTYEHLFIQAPLGGRTLRQKSNGLDTYWLQYYLYQLRFFNNQPHGYFDQATDKAVRAFQSQAGITEDGIVGPQTFLALGTSIPFPQMEYYYRVQKGDSLFMIAKLFGKDMDEIIALNEIKPPTYTIYPGQLLKIPMPLTFHLAKKWDTLESLVPLYFLALENLQEANNLVPAGYLLPDESIILPGYEAPLRGKAVYLQQNDENEALIELDLASGESRRLQQLKNLSAVLLFLSKDRKAVALFQNVGQEINIYNLETDTTRILGLPAPADYLDWSYDNQKLVVGNGLVINALNGKTLFRFNGLFPQWFTDNISLLFLNADQNSFKKINTETGVVETVLERPDDFIWSFQLSTPANKLLFLSFVPPGRVSFTYLYDLNSKELQEVSRNDFFAEWSRSKASFMIKTRDYYGEFFPWFYQDVRLFSQKATLVNRELYAKELDLNTDNFFSADLAFLTIMQNPFIFYPISTLSRNLYAQQTSTRLLTQLSSGQLLYNPVWV